MVTSNPAAFHVNVPGSIDGDEVRNDQKTRLSIIVESYTEMPTFKRATLETACSTTSSFQTTVANLNYAQAQQRLKAEMLRIADTLRAQDVLGWGLTQGSIYCGNQKLR